MSVCENGAVSTPNMDALARAGVRFERSYCAAPVCGPSRAALMTGRMPHAVGVNVNDVPFDESNRTMGHILRAGGYETAYAGHWHLPEGWYDEPGGVDKYGFIFQPFAHPPSPSGWLASGIDPVTTEAAVAFLGARHDERPFLLVVSLTNPHDICYSVMERSIRPRSAELGPDLPANFEIDPDEPEFVAACRRREHYGMEVHLTRDWTDDEWRGYLHAYYRFVEAADRDVGRIMQALRDAGLERDTLVVFSSDHGEGIAGHRWLVKLMLYEEPVTVPLVLSWPGVIGAGVVDRRHLASGVDLLPTLCDYAGIPIPGDIDGQSLRPVIERPELDGRAFVVAELSPDPKEPGRIGRMLRTGRYKYMAFSCGLRAEMLFDLETDAGEMRNLAADRCWSAVLDEHRRLLEQWVVQTRDCFPTRGAGRSSCDGT